jgi:hypothetical protein
LIVPLLPAAVHVFEPLLITKLSAVVRVLNHCNPAPIIEMARMIWTIVDNVLATVHEEPLLIGRIL